MRLKEEKQKAYARAKAIARGESQLAEEGEVEGSQKDVLCGEENIEVDAEGIASLNVKAINAKLKDVLPAVVESEEEEEDAPVLLNPELPNLLSVLGKADVILQVLDARDPLAFRSRHVEDIAAKEGKKILFVLNKIGGYLINVSCASYVELLTYRSKPKRGCRNLVRASTNRAADVTVSFSFGIPP